jgi:hypothetical protein
LKIQTCWSFHYKKLVSETSVAFIISCKYPYLNMETTMKRNFKVTRNVYDVLGDDGEDDAKIYFVRSKEESDSKIAELNYNASVEKEVAEKTAQSIADDNLITTAHNEKFSAFNMFRIYENSMAPKNLQGCVEFSFHEIPKLVQTASIYGMSHSHAMECLDGIISAAINVCSGMETSMGENYTDLFSRAVYGVTDRGDNSRMHIRLRDTRGYRHICDMISILRVIQVRFKNAILEVKRVSSLKVMNKKAFSWTTPKAVADALDASQLVLDDLETAICRSGSQLTALIAGMRERKATKAAIKADPKTSAHEVTRKADPKTSAHEVTRKVDPKTSAHEVTHKAHPKTSAHEVTRKVYPKTSAPHQMMSPQMMPQQTMPQQMMPQQTMPQQTMPPQAMPHQYMQPQYMQPQQMMPPQAMSPQAMSPQYMQPQWLDKSYCVMQTTPTGQMQMIPVGYTLVVVPGPNGADTWLHCDSYR